MDSLLSDFIHWARNRDYVTTRYAGGVKEIPDQFIILEAGHHIEDFTATGTDVDWTQWA